MGNPKTVQQRMFQQIREQLPPHLSIVDEVADLLEISSDSTYRRLRGEKQLILSELLRLCDRFNLSLDAFLKQPQASVPFQHVEVNASTFTVDQYLDFAHQRALELGSHEETELLVVANDLTIFQLLQLPELAAFKLFFWQKSSLGFEDLKFTKFSLDVIPPSLLQKGEAIVREYVKIPSIEIIGIDAVNSFLRQINYYLELGFLPIPTMPSPSANASLNSFTTSITKQMWGSSFPLEPNPRDKRAPSPCTTMSCLSLTASCSCAEGTSEPPTSARVP